MWQGEDALARLRGHVPEVLDKELRALVRKRVRLLRQRLRLRAECLEALQLPGPRIELRKVASRALVIRTQLRVLRGELRRERLEAQEDVGEVRLAPLHDEELPAELDVDPHALDRQHARACEVGRIVEAPPPVGPRREQPPPVQPVDVCGVEDGDAVVVAGRGW